MLTNRAVVLLFIVGLAAVTPGITVNVPKLDFSADFNSYKSETQSYTNLIHTKKEISQFEDEIHNSIEIEADRVKTNEKGESLNQMLRKKENEGNKQKRQISEKESNKQGEKEKEKKLKDQVEEKIKQKEGMILKHIYKINKNIKVNLTNFQNITTQFDELSLVDSSALGYYLLYKYADTLESFQLCDRFTLLTKLRSFMGSSDYSQVQDPINQLISGLIAELPAGIRGIGFQDKLRISDQNGLGSVIVTDPCPGCKYTYYLNVSSVSNDAQWVFVPTIQQCVFWIRNESADGCKLNTGMYNYNYNDDQRRVMCYGAGVNADQWRVSSYDEEADLFILNNTFYKDNLNIDVSDGRVYMPLDGKQNEYKIIKLST